MKKGCSRIFLGCLGLMILFSIIWSLMNFTGAPGPGDPIIPISRETTFVEGPLNADGDVDHVEYLNQLHSEGVTPENNAAVAMLKLVGPGVIEAELRGMLCARLGIEPLPVEGDWFQEFDSHTFYLKKNKAISEAQADALNLQHNYAMGYAWSPEEVPDVASWYQEQESALEEIHRLSALPYFYVPLLDDSPRPMLMRTRLVLVQEARALARTLTVSARGHLHDGDIDATFADSLAIRRIARLLGQGPTLVEQLVAIAIDSVAAYLEFDIALSGLATREQLKEYRDLIAALPPPGNMRDRINKTERMGLLNSLTVLGREGSTATSEFTGQQHPLVTGLYDSLVRDSTDWGEAARVANIWFDDFDEALEADNFPDRRVAIDQLEQRLREQQESVGLGSAVKAMLGGRTAKGSFTGKVLVSMMLPAVTSALAAETRSLSINRIMQIVFSLAMYKVDHGEYPESLDLLVHEYLDKLPVDAYSEKPFPYQRTEAYFRIYTVGPNQTDDGGADYDAGGDDYLLEYPWKDRAESWQEYKAQHQRDSDGLDANEDGDSEDEDGEEQNSNAEENLETMEEQVPTAESDEGKDLIDSGEQSADPEAEKPESDNMESSKQPHGVEVDTKKES